MSLGRGLQLEGRLRGVGGGLVKCLLGRKNGFGCGGRGLLRRRALFAC